MVLDRGACDPVSVLTKSAFRASLGEKSSNTPPSGTVERSPLMHVLRLDVGPSVNQHVNRVRSIVVRCQKEGIVGRQRT